MADNNGTETFFDLPDSPEEFSVILPPASLRRIDFSALEYETLLRSIIEYIKTYHSDKFNDFVSNNGVIMLSELISYVGSIMSTHADILAEEAFLPTAQTALAVDQHLKLINRARKRQTPAVVDLTVAINTPVATTVRVPAGTKFSLKGPDGNPLTYELFRAPGDFTSDIEIPPGKTGVIGYGIEGSFVTPVDAVSAGGPDQEVVITQANILDEPIFVDISSGATLRRWSRIDYLQKAGPTDEVYQIDFEGDDMIIKFGDNKNGKAPISGQDISITYRIGGGIRGRIASSVINEARSISPDAPASAPIEVSFRNLEPSNGGNDAESIETAKKFAPKESAAQGSATTGEDYAILANSFNHPHFGAVLKSVATVRTELNANLVELYVLASGSNGDPVQPSVGLKQGLESFLSDIHNITNEVRVLDGEILPVDLEMQVVISRNADASAVKDEINNAISSFFDITDRNMGDGLYLSPLYEAIQGIDGVQNCRVFSPEDNIIPTDQLRNTEAATSSVAINELIVLGNQKVDVYFEKQRN